MNNIKRIVLAISLAFSVGAMAESMSKNDYAAAKEKISLEYKANKLGCISFSGNAKDICGAQANAKDNIARADLEAVYEPSVKTKYRADIAKAESNYAVAAERCDDMAGNAKDVCMKEAKAIETNFKAEAEVQMKVSNANAAAEGKSANAYSKAGATAVEARQDAAAEKVDAQYEVAKEKCNVYAASAKDHCLEQAKLQFIKS